MGRKVMALQLASFVFKRGVGQSPSNKQMHYSRFKIKQQQIDVLPLWTVIFHLILRESSTSPLLVQLKLSERREEVSGTTCFPASCCLCLFLYRFPWWSLHHYFQMPSEFSFYSNDLKSSPYPKVLESLQPDWLYNPSILISSYGYWHKSVWEVSVFSPNH